MKFALVVMGMAGISLAVAACGGSSVVPAPTIVPGSVVIQGTLVPPGERPPRGMVDAFELQRASAEELRRLRDEHASLIESATTPTPEAPTPTPEAQVRQEIALARVLAWPDGIPAGGNPDRDWFNPERGIEFYRETGGDWTSRSTRDEHSHRALFYYENYPPHIANFDDGSMQREVARELVFETARVLPLLDEPHPAMIELFQNRLGWELRDSRDPAVNFWTQFTFVKGGVEHEFAIGGVMRMGVASEGAGEEMWEYLVLGEWLGPVVVERLR